MRTRMVTAVLLGLLLVGPGRPGQANHAADPASWIVTLAPGVDPTVEAPVLAASAGGSLGFVYSAVLGGFSFTGTSLQADILRTSPLVSSVVADGPAHLATAHTQPAQLEPSGVSRISGPAARIGGRTGAGVTVAVIDSGVDLAHPDLLANLHPTLGANCITPGLPPADDNSHGTHVAGTIAAADNAIGVVGVAPAATLVPVKAFDAVGDSTWAKVICGIDYVAQHAAQIDVANMSFGDLSTAPTACDGVTTSDIDALRQSICDLTAAGVVAVAAAGNNRVDVAGFVPAAFPETVAASAFTDLDGQPGGAAGCVLFGAICDDTFAYLFSNYGPRIDVMAPGFEILSTIPGGAYGLKDGTSMAAPHVAGVAALILQADPTLGPAAVRDMLRRSGECPDGAVSGADGTCTEQGSWGQDPDSTPEPLVHALRAAELAAANGMHVGDLDGARTVARRSWQASVTIAAHTATESVLNGAVVSFTWTGGASGSGTCTTKKGVCKATSPSMPLTTASATLTITGLTAAGRVYTPTRNHDPDGDSTGTGITVAR